MQGPREPEIQGFTSMLLNAICILTPELNALKRGASVALLSSVSQITFTDHLHCSRKATAAVRRRSAKKTMQAATLVALLIPVVAIWITVVVRYGRSIEEIVVATTIEKEE